MALRGSASLAFMQRNEKLGALSLLTIPNIGWVAKDMAGQSVDVPLHGGPALSAGSEVAFTQFYAGGWTVPYDPAVNRALTSVQSLPSKGAPFAYPPDLNDGKVFQDERVAYLKSQRPQGALAPVYEMDNEPELWADNLHVDVHPIRQGYDDMLHTFLAYARPVNTAYPGEHGRGA